MKPLRVLVVTPDYPPAKGGIQRLFHDITHNLRECEVEVVAAGRSTPADRADAIRVRRAGDYSRLDRRLGIVAVNARAVARGLAWRPDVVLSAHIMVAPAAAAIGRAAGCGYVQWVHGSEMAHRPRVAGWACARAAAVIASSRFSAGLAVGAGAPPERVEVVHPGINCPVFEPSLSGREPIVVWVARMQERYKGLDVLIRAMGLVRAAVPGARLHAVGDGPLREAAEALAQACGLGDAVVFEGRLDDNARDALLDRAKCLVMVSRVGATGLAEGFGIVYLEAAAHGLAVVAGNAGGAVDAVVDGVTGILVDPSDHVATAGAVIRLLSDEEERRRLALGGLRLARERDWLKVGDQVRAVLRRVAVSAPRRK